jgi:hypothetical protein
VHNRTHDRSPATPPGETASARRIVIGRAAWTLRTTPLPMRVAGVGRSSYNIDRKARDILVTTANGPAAAALSAAAAVAVITAGRRRKGAGHA